MFLYFCLFVCLFVCNYMLALKQHYIRAAWDKKAILSLFLSLTQLFLSKSKTKYIKKTRKTLCYKSSLYFSFTGCTASKKKNPNQKARKNICIFLHKTYIISK